MPSGDGLRGRGIKKPRPAKNAKVPTRPTGLGRYGNQLWDRVAVTRSAYLCLEDGAMMETLCRTWQDLCVASRSYKGVPDRETRLTVNHLRQTFCSLQARFGLTPSDRRQFDDEEKDDTVALRARFVS